MPLNKEFKEQLADHLQELSEEQREIFLSELDSQMDQAVTSAHKKAVAAKTPTELQAAYQLEVAKVRRGSNEALQIRKRYRRLGVKI